VELAYPVAAGAARLMLRALGLRIDVEGVEHVPAAGPFLRATRHVPVDRRTRRDRSRLGPVAIWGPQRIATARRPVDLHRGRPVSVSISVAASLRLPPSTDVAAATVDLGIRLQEMLDRLQARPRHQPAPGDSAPWHPAGPGGSAPTRAEAALRESSPSSAIRWWEREGPVQGE
jgi:1-acyl-sn-glycerol-3-phosphate acyltransferase